MTRMRVCIEDKNGVQFWSYGDGHGETSCAYLHDGTQRAIIEALLVALAEARGQLSSALNETNVVPYVRAATAKIERDVPITA